MGNLVALDDKENRLALRDEIEELEQSIVKLNDEFGLDTE